MGLVQHHGPQDSMIQIMLVSIDELSVSSASSSSLIWVNYNDLTATSLGIMVSIGNHPQMALFQVNELL